MSELSPRARLGVRAAVVLLLLAAAVLAVLVAQTASEEEPVAGPVTEVGASPVETDDAFYGRETVVKVPGLDVTTVVGDPVAVVERPRLAYGSDDGGSDTEPAYRAQDDGLLVPVSWRVRTTQGYAETDEPTAVPLRLVAGDDTVEVATIEVSDLDSLSEAVQTRTVLVRVDGGLDRSDLRLEVGFDGVTQSLDLGTGEIDAGRAQPLYEGDTRFDTGCDDPVSRCEQRADGALRPTDSSLRTGGLYLFPWSAVRGWAPEGRLWAGVDVTAYDGYEMAAADGDSFPLARPARPVVTLDGAEPVDAGALVHRNNAWRGYLVWSVEADAVPERLRFDQQARLRDGRRVGIGTTLGLVQE